MDENFEFNSEKKLGWIILCFSLAVIIIMLIIMMAFSLVSQSNIPECNCYGQYGLKIGVDATEKKLCGRTRDKPCIFRKNSLADCVTECNLLSNICEAFTFNEINQTMKIVQPTTIFQSNSSNLFVRQSGI